MYKRCSGYIAFVCQKFCHNKEDAEEVVQDTFVIAYKKADKLRGETLLAYLRKIAIYECYRKRDDTLGTVLSNTYPLDTHEESYIDFLPEAYISVKEQRIELLRIIMSLPKMQWETVYLYYYASLTTEEIATLQNCSTSNVRKTLRNARAAIKDRLEEKSGTPKGILLASAGTVSLAAIMLAEEQAFAAVYLSAAAPCWATVGAASTMAASGATTAAASGAAAASVSGYIVAACVATFVAVSAITYVALWPDPDPPPIIEPYIVYEATQPPQPQQTPAPTTEPPRTSPTEPTPEPEPITTVPPTTTPPPTVPPTTPVIYAPQPTPASTTPPPPPPTPAPTPVPDRTPQIMAALNAANTPTDVAQIIQAYDFQFARVIRVDDEELRFYVTDEGSGDILIGTAMSTDSQHFRLVFALFNNGVMPTHSMDLISFMERD